MKIDVHHHYDPAVIGRLETILTMQETMMADQAALNAKLTELADAISAEMKQLADAIAAQAPDLSPQVAKVQELIDALKSDDPAPVAAAEPTPTPTTDTPPA